jgi:sporulation-control protein spo0M
LFTIIYYLLAGDTEVLPSGEHSFQFSMILPYNLPSSFEGQYGHVRYTVKATLDRPWKFDHEVKAAFTVLSHLDLNLDPQNRVRPEFNENAVNLWTVPNTE